MKGDIGRGVASIEAEEAVASSLFADLVVRWVRTIPIILEGGADT